MPDERTLVEKLRAMAEQAASPREAAVARRLLERLAGSGAHPQTPGIVSRESVLSTPDRDSHRGTLRYRTKGGTWVTVDIEDWSIDLIKDDDLMADGNSGL